MKIAVFGLGYVGLVTSVVLANKGFKIYGFENDVSKISKLKNNQLYIKEKNLAKLFNSKKVKNNFSAHLVEDNGVFFDTNFEIIIIAVGTPSTLGKVNLNYVIKVLKLIKNKLKKTTTHTSIVIKSTVPPGTTDTIAKKILHDRFNSDKIGIGMNPEFLREGSAINDFINSDRIVIGYEDDNTKKKLIKLYQSWSCEKIITNSRTAEMIKYSNNALLSLQISTANYLANLSSSIKNIEIKDLIHGIHSDRRWSNDQNKKSKEVNISSYLKPGIGFGGSCLPKDLEGIVNLGKKLKVKNNIFDVVDKINKNQSTIISNLILKILRMNKINKILFLGYSFKENTDDFRNSPTLEIVERIKKNKFSIYMHDFVLKSKKMKDYHKKYPNIHFIDDWNKYVSNNILIIPIHKDIRYSKLKNNIKLKYIFDPKNLYNKKDFLHCAYYDICF